MPCAESTCPTTAAVPTFNCVLPRLSAFYIFVIFSFGCFIFPIFPLICFNIFPHIFYLICAYCACFFQLNCLIISHIFSSSVVLRLFQLSCDNSQLLILLCSVHHKIHLGKFVTSVLLLLFTCCFFSVVSN